MYLLILLHRTLAVEELHATGAHLALQRERAEAQAQASQGRKLFLRYVFHEVRADERRRPPGVSAWSHQRAPSDLFLNSVFPTIPLSCLQVRVPFNAVTMALEALEIEPGLSEEGRDTLTMASSSAASMKSVINNVVRNEWHC